MEEERLKSYFKRQVHAILQRSFNEREGFHAYFADRPPNDDEILGLLAISAMMSGDFKRVSYFPSPSEALAALSPTSRSEICQEFRRGLKASPRGFNMTRPGSA